MKKIKILIPVYNDWRSVFKLMENIDRRLEDWKPDVAQISVIIINDASTEKKPNIFSIYNRLKSIEVINMKENKGHARCIAAGLKYITKNGRTVYGGGGVTPDSIIIRDTTLNYIKFNRIRSKNWISEFALTYRDKVDKSKSVDALDKEKIYINFLSYIKSKKDKNFDFTMGLKEEDDLKLYIKAQIVKNNWDKNEYFKVINSTDLYILKSLDILDKK